MAKWREEPVAERLTPALQAEELLGLGAEVASAISTALITGRSDEAVELAWSRVLAFLHANLDRGVAE